MVTGTKLCRYSTISNLYKPMIACMCSTASLSAFELLWFVGLCFHLAELLEFLKF